METKFRLHVGGIVLHKVCIVRDIITVKYEYINVKYRQNDIIFIYNF